MAIECQMPKVRKLCCDGCGWPTLPDNLRCWANFVNGAIVTHRYCLRCVKRRRLEGKP